MTIFAVGLHVAMVSTRSSRCRAGSSYRMFHAAIVIDARQLGVGIVLPMVLNVAADEALLRGGVGRYPASRDRSAPPAANTLSVTVYRR